MSVTMRAFLSDTAISAMVQRTTHVREWLVPAASAKERNVVAKATKPVKTPLERAINSRQKGIERMRKNIADIRRKADEQIAVIQRHIEQKQVLLDALKRGALKP